MLIYIYIYIFRGPFISIAKFSFLGSQVFVFVRSIRSIVRSFAMDSFFQSTPSSSWSYDSLKNLREISPVVQNHLKLVSFLNLNFSAIFFFWFVCFVVVLWVIFEIESHIFVNLALSFCLIYICSFLGIIAYFDCCLSYLVFVILGVARVWNWDLVTLGFLDGNPYFVKLWFSFSWGVCWFLDSDLVLSYSDCSLSDLVHGLVDARLFLTISLIFCSIVMESWSQGILKEFLGFWLGILSLSWNSDLRAFISPF